MSQETSHCHPVHIVNQWHQGRASQVITLLERLGYLRMMAPNAHEIRFMHPRQQGDQIALLWWALDHLPQSTEPLDMEDVQRWHRIWSAGRRLLGMVEPGALPAAAQEPFAVFLTAWTASRARWWLRRESAVLLTPAVQEVLDGLDAQTPEERRLLTVRRAIWQEHYQRYVERHPRRCQTKRATQEDEGARSAGGSSSSHSLGAN